MKRLYYFTIALFAVAIIVTGCSKDELETPAPADKIDVAIENDSDITAAFTDPVFRAYVIKNFCAGREVIMQSDVEKVVAVVDVSAMEISSLAGIEHFTAITTLSCVGNKLESLDVSACADLTSLVCSGNNLSTLKVGGKLEHLDCSANKLGTLDISGCSKMWYLDCRSNALTTLDTSACLALEHIERDLDKSILP